MMTPTARTLHAVLGPLFLAGAAGAQARVWLVDDDGGPGVDFTTIQAAVDAAVDGELVLVREGVYDAFEVVDEALVVFADAGADVQVSGCLVVRDLGVGRAFTLRGFRQSDHGFGYLTARFSDNQGPLWIEECRFRSGLWGAGTCPGLTTTVYAERSTSVALVRSRIGLENTFVVWGEGVSAGLRVADGDAHLYDTEVWGGSGPGNGSHGQWGLRVERGAVFASGSTVRGGDGAGAYPMDGPISECYEPKDGGHGLVLGEDARFTRLEGPIAGGAGGSNEPASFHTCTPPILIPGTDGADVVFEGGTLEDLEGTARHLVANSPVREGETWRVDLEGEPGDLAVLAIATQHLPLGYFAPWKGVVLNVVPFSVSALGVVPASGQLSASGTVLDYYAPGQGLALYFQAAVVTSGGELVLTPGSVQVQLDGGL